MNQRSFAVTIGSKRINLPVFEFSRGDGPHVVITAGMDGDEYASIDAAYKIAEYLSSQPLSGKVTILPIVNIPGFEAEISKNPMDGKYPKHIYPGKKDGSPTEQLMWAISEAYIKDALVWIDLHGGALTERLTPFVWTYDVTNTALSQLTHKFRRKVTSDIVVAERDVSWGKIERLTRDSVVYVILESGEGGKRENMCIDMHVRWVKELLAACGVSADVPDAPKSQKTTKTVLTHVHEYVATREGIWYPTSKALGSIRVGSLIGTIISRDGKSKHTLTAKHSGITLWSKVGMSVQKGDVLWAIGN